ncbi:MAG: tetratricopeptide repeat protein [Chloroflexi bacterium]|nr:tetratricopeptide repeat protein [Chloroflexota bacterium]
MASSTSHSAGSTAPGVSLIHNRYRIIDRIGDGGMGAVFRVYDRLNRQDVALKQVHVSEEQQDASDSTQVDRAEGFRVALAHEFRTLASLRHPNVVFVFDYGFDSLQQPYFTMELVEHGRTMVEAGLDQALTLQMDLVIQLLQALSYLHRRGVVHRDLKPANVLVTPDNQVKVVDFGLALARELSLDGSDRNIAGTVAYMAPEILQGQPASLASDLYAVGVMIFQMYANRPLFQAKAIASLISQIVNDTPDLSVVPEKIRPYAARLLAKAPTERFDSANEAIAALCDVLSIERPAESATLRESYLRAAAFVGRKPQLEALLSAFAKAKAGQGSAWLIGGESGVGKSRLLEELRIRAMVDGALTLRGQAVEGGGVAYQLWRNVLPPLILSTELGDLEASVLKTVLPDLEDLIGRPVGDAPPLDDAPARQRLALTIYDLFKRQEQPIVLLLEDLQWTVESLVPLKTLTRFVEDLPILIVGSYRDDEHPDLPKDLPDMEVISLERLSPEAISELSAAMLGDAGQRQQVIDLLQKETEGNTLFIIEVMRVLADEAGSLHQIGMMTLPDSVFARGIQTVLQRRIRQVPAEYRDVLRLTAVAGRQVDQRVLLNLVDGDRQEMDAFLIACANAAIIEYVEPSWRFTHDKLRDVVLKSLTKADQPKAHRKVAQAIESAYGDHDDYADVLIEHWHGAGDPERELHYAEIASERALTIGNARRGIELARRALELVDESETTGRGRLLIRLGTALAITGEYDEARGTLAQVLAISDSDKAMHAQALVYMAKCDEHQGSLDSAAAHAQAAKHLAEESHSVRTLAMASQILGVIAHHRGESLVAKDFYELSLQLRRETNDLVGVATALSSLGIVARDLQDNQQAEAYYREALATSELVGDRIGIGRTLTNLGALKKAMGLNQESLAMQTEALKIKREVGDRYGEAITLNNLGLLSYDMGDPASGDRYLDEALAVNKAVGNRYGVMESFANRGHVAAHREDYGDALRFYSGAIELALELNIVPFQLEVIGGVARMVARYRPHASAAWIVYLEKHPAADAAVREFGINPAKDALRDALGGDEPLQEALSIEADFELPNLINIALAELHKLATEAS